MADPEPWPGIVVVVVGDVVDEVVDDVVDDVVVVVALDPLPGCAGAVVVVVVGVVVGTG